jgi:hypothetical protein
MRLVRRGGDFDRLERDVFCAAAAALGEAAAGPIDEDPAHGFGGGGEEMCAVLPRRLRLAAEAEPRFVDECGGLQGLVGGFARHAGGGQLAQLIVNEGQQLVGRLDLAASDAAEEVREVAGGHAP